MPLDQVVISRREIDIQRVCQPLCENLGVVWFRMALLGEEQSVVQDRIWAK